MSVKPRYIETKHSGRLAVNIRKSHDLLNNCTLCPRNCKVNRLEGETGICKTGENAIISSYMPHFGEEPPISGVNGSGTIFLTNCNLKCCFCQNDDISLNGQGQEAEPGQLASVMLLLQEKGCHNINLVTPTHVVPQFLSALSIAIDHGLTLPIVYNSSGYDKKSTLELLDGVIDIYMPDFKFWDSKVSKRLCNAPDYPEIAKEAIKEMYRQVGDLKTDNDHIARSGLLVRHLVMPENLAGTLDIVNFLHDQISVNTHVNIMSQYHPAADAFKFPEIARSVTPGEFRTALDHAVSSGLPIVR